MDIEVMATQIAHINRVLVDANQAMAGGVKRISELEARVHELETALNRMICAHENLSANTEGRYPEPDSGCIECTCGTVPDKYNTGLCAFHTAKKLLGQ